MVLLGTECDIYRDVLVMRLFWNVSEGSKGVLDGSVDTRSTWKRWMVVCVCCVIRLFGTPQEGQGASEGSWGVPTPRDTGVACEVVEGIW